MRMSLLSLAMLTSYGLQAQAVQIVPVSYDTINGHTATYNYWDDTYNGSGCKTCDGAFLIGGLGDLSNGIIPTLNWSVVEPPAGPGPYVGWLDVNPTLTFHFGAPVSIDTVTFHFDDSADGGVAAPISVIVNGTTYPVANPPGTAPFAFTTPSLAFSGADLTMTINRGARFTFASEVQFFSSAVPELPAWMSLSIGLVAVSLYLRRKHPRPAPG